MKVKCISNTNKNLQKNTIYERFEVYPLEIEKEYNIYGIFTWKGKVYYLLQDAESYHAELFKIVNNLLLASWYFNLKKTLHFDLKTKKEYEMIEKICGYKELVLDSDHYINLVEREPKAVEIFERRKAEIDEYEELLSTK